MPESNGQHRNIIREAIDGPAPHCHTTEEVVTLLARACRSTCGELGDDERVDAARLLFTRAILDLRQVDPRTEAIVRRLAHERLRIIANDDPAAIPLKDDDRDPWHAHFLLLASDIDLTTYIARGIARHGDGDGCDHEIRMIGPVRITH